MSYLKFKKSYCNEHKLYKIFTKKLKKQYIKKYGKQEYIFQTLNNKIKNEVIQNNTYNLKLSIVKIMLNVNHFLNDLIVSFKILQTIKKINSDHLYAQKYHNELKRTLNLINESKYNRNSKLYNVYYQEDMGAYKYSNLIKHENEFRKTILNIKLNKDLVNQKPIKKTKRNKI